MELTPDQEYHYKRLDKICRDYFAKVKAEGYGDTDDPHYIFEEAMMMILGSDVFTIMNKRDTELANE